MPYSLPVIDGHNDTLLDIRSTEKDQQRSFLERTDDGHIDLPRANAVDYAGAFFSIFVPNEEAIGLDSLSGKHEIELPESIDHTRAKSFTYDRLERLYQIEYASNGMFRVVQSTHELRACLEGDAVGAIVHLEGAGAVAPDLSNLDFLYAAGVRSIGITWSRPNAFGTGVPFAYPGDPDTGPGLTDVGRELVRGCNQRGIVIDLAHLNEAGFWDVHDITTDPIVVSHTGVHSLHPSTRNLTDEQLDAVGESGGIMGISFSTENLDYGEQQDSETPLSPLVDQIMYVIDRIGIDHVGIGSDFDGGTMPEVVGDVTGLTRIITALRERGLNEVELQKLTHENWLRVLDQIW